MRCEREDLQASYDAVAELYVDKYLDGLDRMPLDRELLDRFAGLVRGRGRVCDLGCGPGQVARYLHERGVDVFGLDLSGAMIEAARRLMPELSFVQGDMATLDADDDSWAGIAAFYSIIHLPRDEVAAVLQELRRVLQPGGRLLLAFHLGDQDLHWDEWLGRAVDVDVFLFERSEMEGYLVQAGLEIDEVVERDHYPDIEYASRRAYIFARKPSG